MRSLRATEGFPRCPTVDCELGTANPIIELWQSITLFLRYLRGLLFKADRTEGREGNEEQKTRSDRAKPSVSPRLLLCHREKLWLVVWATRW
jgi:hypothetical protein